MNRENVKAIGIFVMSAGILALLLGIYFTTPQENSGTTIYTTTTYSSNTAQCVEPVVVNGSEFQVHCVDCPINSNSTECFMYLYAPYAQSMNVFYYLFALLLTIGAGLYCIGVLMDAPQNKISPVE